MHLYGLLLILAGVTGALSVWVEEGSSAVLTCQYNIPHGGHLLTLSWKFQPHNSTDQQSIWTVDADSVNEKTSDTSIDVVAADTDTPLDYSHSIELLAVTLNLEGEFTCNGDYFNDAENAYDSFPAFTIPLIVTVKAVPVIVLMDEASWVEGQTAFADCQVDRAKPMISDLYLEGHPSIIRESQLENKPNNDERTYSVLQRNLLTLDWTENGKTRLKCVAVWNGMQILSEEKLVTDLRYSPKQSPQHSRQSYAAKDESTDILFHFYANPTPVPTDTLCHINSTDNEHFYIAVLHIEKVTDEDFKMHQCTVGNEEGDTKLYMELDDITMKNAGLAAGVVVGVLCVLGALAIVGYMLWKRRQDRETPPQSSRMSYTKEQNGNYEPYCELADEREKKVTPQRPIPAQRPPKDDDCTYEEVNTDIKTRDNPKPSAYSDVYVKTLPEGEKPVVRGTVPKTEYSAVHFSNKPKEEDNDSD